MSDDQNYVYSDNNEIFNYDSLEDALDCVDAGETVTIYKGVTSERHASHFVYANAFIDDIAERAYEECGEFAEDWLVCVEQEQIKELEKQLEAAVDAWADKHKLQPTWYMVKDVQELKIKVLNDEGDYEIIED